MTALAAVGIDGPALTVVIVLTTAVTLGGVFLGVRSVSRKLLGIAIGPLRALFAGLVALGTLSVFAHTVPEEGSHGVLTAVRIGLSLFAAMIAIILTDVFLPHGSWTLPLRLLRGASARFRRARRYSQISRILMRNGLGRLLRSRSSLERAMSPGEFGEQSARALRTALEECGGVFVKLGQVLSTRRDILPQHFVDELSRLQSSVPPAPWSEVEALLCVELGKPVEQAFEWFERKPLAAASIAQVHRARLHGGPTVVVKVQRPGVREMVERDLDILLAVTRGLDARVRYAQSLGLRELGDGFAQSLREEIDFRIEARNSGVIGMACRGFEDDAAVRVPQVHRSYTSARVLVQEWLEGVTLDRAQAVAQKKGLDRRAMAKTILSTMLHQILRAGVFHADPHPGNVLLLEDGRIGLIDFGSVGRIGLPARIAIQELLVSVERGDPARLHDALLALLGTRATMNEELMPDPLVLERELGRFMAQHLGAGAQPDSETFAALFRMLSRFGLAVPPEIAAVFRALATVEGTLAQLAPGFNLLEEARAFAVEMVTEELRFRRRMRPDEEAAGNGFELPGFPALAHSLAHEFLSVLPMLRRLPRRVERISSALEEGRLGVRVRFLADERERRFVTGLLHQLTVTLLAACTGLMGVMLVVFGTRRGPYVTEQLEFYPLLGYHLLAVSAILMLRALHTAMRRSP